MTLRARLREASSWSGSWIIPGLRARARGFRRRSAQAPPEAGELRGRAGEHRANDSCSSRHTLPPSILDFGFAARYRLRAL